MREKVHSDFKAKLGIFADILKKECAKVEVPEVILYTILPFLWGDKISEGVLNDVVTYVGSLLDSDLVAPTTKKAKKGKSERSAGAAGVGKRRRIARKISGGCGGNKKC